MLRMWLVGSAARLGSGRVRRLFEADSGYMSSLLASMLHGLIGLVCPLICSICCRPWCDLQAIHIPVDSLIPMLTRGSLWLILGVHGSTGGCIKHHGTWLPTDRSCRPGQRIETLNTRQPHILQRRGIARNNRRLWNWSRSIMISSGDLLKTAGEALVEIGAWMPRSASPIFISLSDRLPSSKDRSMSGVGRT